MEATTSTRRRRSRLLMKLDARTRLHRSLDDIQGIALHGYHALKRAGYLFLAIADPERCRAWLRETPIRTARWLSEQERREPCLNIAFTWRGLEALGLSRSVLDTFPRELREGMARRAAILGDHPGTVNDPAHWRFGAEDDLHVLLMLFARDEAALEELLARQRERLATGGLVERYYQEAWLPGGNGTGAFGFRDGISQPIIDGLGSDRSARYLPKGDRPVRAGEFILGYPNEYGDFPESPTVAPEEDPDRWLEDAPGPWWSAPRRDLGRNGSYLVLRKLQTRTDLFERFLEENAREMDSDLSPRQRRELLAAKMVGRWQNGAPLLPGATTPPPVAGRADNSFLFDRDRHGLGCPVTSHIRRSNPRDSLGPTPRASLALVRRHRLIRRGRLYDDGTEQGMIFIALNANIRRQFEFVQRSWVDNGKFGGRPDEPDPLLGSRGGASSFTIPREPIRRCLRDLPGFVETRGGGYFFLPGARALCFLAGLRGG